MQDIDDLVLYLAFTATFCWEDETELRSSLFGTIKRGNGECRGKADDGSEQVKGLVGISGAIFLGQLDT